MAQSKTGSTASLPRPKLVVGIMVDQMRWDYLYRFYDRYNEKGFKRMLREGVSCENAMIPYAQTVTAAGHTSVYTGSVPSLHGIMGNEWFDKQLNREVDQDLRQMRKEVDSKIQKAMDNPLAK